MRGTSTRGTSPGALLGIQPLAVVRDEREERDCSEQEVGGNQGRLPGGGRH